MALDTCLSGERVTNTRLLLIEYSDGGVKKELRIQDNIAAWWKKLAPFLGFEVHDIQNIEQSKFFQTDSCATMMLSSWMTRDPDCTWRKLILSMRKARIGSAADLAKALRNIVQ